MENRHAKLRFRPLLKKRELLGNYFEWKGEIAKVTDVFEFEVGFKCGDVGFIKDLEPIPITEERLLKCGFELRKESDNFYYFGYGTNPRTKDWMLCLKYFKYENRFFFLNGHHKIEFIHQLQNLYFVLTGEELEFKF